jgi:hypothetical protein
MDEKNIFREALSNFTFDVASGGAIEHLAELGYSPQEIQNMLDFPTPYGRVQDAYWKYLRKKKIVVEEKSELEEKQEKVSFVTEYDAYGHKSFRRVVEYEQNQTAPPDFDQFRTISYRLEVHGNFASFLNEYCCGGKADECAGTAYVSCDFGLRMKRAPEEYEAFLKPLGEEQRRYLEGIPWVRKTVWHQLNQRMVGILAALYEKSSYHGTILLLTKKEQINF